MSRLLLSVLLVLAWFAPGQASAAGDCSTGTNACTYSEAFAQCTSYNASRPPSSGSNTFAYRCNSALTTYFVQAQRQINGSGSWSSDNNFYYQGGLTCPAGQEVDPAGGCRCPGGYKVDPFNPAQCMNQQKCLALNAGLGSNPARPSLSASRCLANGCKFSMGSDPSKYEVRNDHVFGDAAGTTRTTYRGVMEYTGEPCGSQPVDPNFNEAKVKNPDGQECQGVGGWTLCVKKDGQHCMSASNHRFMCWDPREVGEKIDEDTLQKRVPGPTEIPPDNLQLPTGDTLVKKGDSVVSTSTINNTTTTTTTTNYTTINGTNPGGDRADGETNDGQSGDGGPGADKGEEGKNGAAGGRNCETPLQTTGDPLLGEIAQQQFLARCGDGSGPPSQDKYTGEAGDNTGAWGDGEIIGDDGLDTDGLGFGSTCPAIQTVQFMGTSINLDANGTFCDWMHLGGYFCMLIGTLVSLRIMTSGGKS